jgi:hypothetical protein
LSQDAVADAGRTDEIDRSLEQLLQLGLEIEILVETARDAVAREDNGQINIAVRPEVVPQRRTEKGQFPDGVLPAQSRYLLTFFIDDSHDILFRKTGSRAGRRYFIRGYYNASCSYGNRIEQLWSCADHRPSKERTAQRLYRTLRGLPVPVDLLVTTATDLARHKDNPGLIYRAIVQEGRELYAV